jgi:hypothetical protein
MMDSKAVRLRKYKVFLSKNEVLFFFLRKKKKQKIFDYPKERNGLDGRLLFPRPKVGDRNESNNRKRAKSAFDRFTVYPAVD